VIEGKGRKRRKEWNVDEKQKKRGYRKIE